MEKTTALGLTFEYQEYLLEQMDSNEVVHIYSKITIIKSNNPKFKAGDKIDQISISEKIYFEHEDGTPY